MHRPVRIDVRRLGRFMGYAATIVRRDDGLTEGGEPYVFPSAFETEEGPFYAWTHRRAWKKAYRACGGRLYDVARDEP